MRLSANFKMILASAATLAMLGVGASAMAQELRPSGAIGTAAGFPGRAGDRRTRGLRREQPQQYGRGDRPSVESAANRRGQAFPGRQQRRHRRFGALQQPRRHDDGGQNLYLCDTNNSDIRQISIGGTVTTVAGQANIAGTEDGTGAARALQPAHADRTDGTSLYVADSGNSTIRRITLADFKVKTIAGQAGTSGKTEGGPDKSVFSGPRGVAVDKKAIYVSDTGNDIIRKIDISTLQTSTLAGTGEDGDKDGPALQAQFNNPGAICTDGTFLYVLDADNHSIRKIDLNANTVTKLTLVNGHIGSGCALTSDGKQLYFSDTTENAVEVVDTTSGNFTTLFPPGQ